MKLSTLRGRGENDEVTETDVEVVAAVVKGAPCSVDTEAQEGS